MLTRLIAHILHVANANPPYGDWRRATFYAMKTRILQFWGTPDGFDVQFITKPCWGPSRYSSCTKEVDCKCGGSGVFDFYWVHLARWRMGGHVFHQPVARGRANPWGKVTIEGLVKHACHGRWSRECQMWLALGCGEFVLFWVLVGMLRDNWATGWKLPPLTLLAKLWNLAEMSGPGRLFIQYIHQQRDDSIPF